MAVSRRAAAPKPHADATSPLFVQSVEKAMKVLTAFDGTRRQLSLSEIAALADLDASAAQRFTYTLSQLGYLVKDPATRKYELSVRLLDFTYHYLASSELAARAAPVLQKLARDTEEVYDLTVPDGADIVFVQRIVSRNVRVPNVIVSTYWPVRTRSPLSPAASAPPTSLSTSSPTMAASCGCEPRSSNTPWKKPGAGLPTTCAL